MMNQEKITGKNQKNKLPFALNILYAKKKMNASYLFYSKKKKKSVIQRNNTKTCW